MQTPDLDHLASLALPIPFSTLRPRTLACIHLPRLLFRSLSVASEDEHDTVPPDQSVNRAYSFVSLPENVVRRGLRCRRYDEIEKLYQCSWTGCTKSYGSLNHINAHIVSQRHGNKRTPAGEIHSSFHEYKDHNRLIVGHLRRNSGSSGNSGARLRKMNRNSRRGWNGLMLCAQGHLFSIPRNLTSGSPSPPWSYRIRPRLRRGPNRPHNTRAQRLPSMVQNLSMLIV